MSLLSGCGGGAAESTSGSEVSVEKSAGAASLSAALSELPSAEAAIVKVNDSWQSRHESAQTAFWHQAVYHVGNLAAWQAFMRGCSNTENAVAADRWFGYSHAWASHNHWQGATGSDPAKWQYKTYGEDQQHVLFADWQVCFQSYLILQSYCQGGGYAEEATDEELAEYGRRAEEVMGHLAHSEAVDYWWWVDATFMALPALAQLTAKTGDLAYIRKGLACLQWTDGKLLDREAGLYYRDGKYVYPGHTTHSGSKDFWARGDGWAIAAMARALEMLPADCDGQVLEALRGRLRSLAAALVACQQPEGHWTRSLLDAQEAPGYETSGTALTCYALAYGVKTGVLEAEKYVPAVAKAWRYLSTVALQSDGRVGYVQPIGEAASPGVTVSAESESDFGTGAFLLAAAELMN